MPVPENIRKVARPKNTVVVNNGKPGPNQYAVRARKTEKYIPGKNPQPVNGKVIGHIIDGKFVPIIEKTAASGPDSLCYGTAALVKSVTRDLLPIRLLQSWRWQNSASSGLGWAPIARRRTTIVHLFAKITQGLVYPRTQLQSCCNHWVKTIEDGSSFIS